MITFEIELPGFDINDSDTGDRIKWVQASSHELIRDFIETNEIGAIEVREIGRRAEGIDLVVNDDGSFQGDISSWW